MHRSAVGQRDIEVEVVVPLIKATSVTWRPRYRAIVVERWQASMAHRIDSILGWLARISHAGRQD